MRDSNLYFSGKTVARFLFPTDDSSYRPSGRHYFYRYSTDARSIEGLIMELGVATGGSLNCLADLVAPAKIYGFDSFEGLPEDWPGNAPKGRNKCDVPKVRENVEIVKGLFADTLPDFARSHPGPISFIHIDCDIYSSTKTVFDNFGPKIVPGTVIMFDEYMDYPGWREHEFKAFQEFIQGRPYEYLALHTIGDSGEAAVSVRVL